MSRPRKPAPGNHAACAMICFATLVLHLAAASFAQGEKDPIAETKRQPEAFCVLPASYEDMRPAVFVLIPRAQSVGFTLLRETSIGLDPYSRKELRNLRLTWRQCLRLGRAAATRHLKTLGKPTIHRNSRGILDYAHFKSDNPLTASIFLSPDFLKMFADTLGKELYVAIPDRSNVFVFPKHSDAIKKYRSKMAIIYKEGLYPVSREFFEVSKEGIRVAGKF